MLSHSSSLTREVFTGCKIVLSLVNEFTRRNDSPSRRCRRGKTIWGGSKDMRSSDSSKKVFVPKVREISAVANWSISISAF